MFNNKFKMDSVAETIKSITEADQKAAQEKLEAMQIGEGWDDMLKSVKDKNKPQPNGGSGVKQGSRYGGGKQKEEPKEQKDEAIDASKLTTDTLAGRIKGGDTNAHTDVKVKLKAEGIEGFKSKLKSGVKTVLAKVGGGSDEDQMKRLQKNMGVPQTGKPAMAKQNEEVEQIDEKSGDYEWYNDPRSGAVDNKSVGVGHLDDNKHVYSIHTTRRNGTITHQTLAHNGQHVKTVKDSEHYFSKHMIPAIKKHAAGLKEETDKEEIILEYGDTTKGQKMLAKVQKRAVDRVIQTDDKNRLEPDVSKRDLKTVRKNAATADRAWERMKEEVEAVDEALKGDQYKLDKNKNNKIDAQDFKMLRKEEDKIDERQLSPAEKDATEVYVKGMKKNLQGFKARYGKNAKSVMYATATKMAKGDK